MWAEIFCCRTLCQSYTEIVWFSMIFFLGLMCRNHRLEQSIFVCLVLHINSAQTSHISISFNMPTWAKKRIQMFFNVLWHLVLRCFSFSYHSQHNMQSVAVGQGRIKWIAASQPYGYALRIGVEKNCRKNIRDMPNKALQTVCRARLSDSNLAESGDSSPNQTKPDCLTVCLSVPVAKILNTVAHIRTRIVLCISKKKTFTSCNLTNADFLRGIGEV